MDDTPETPHRLPEGWQVLGREGSTIYYTDGTMYPCPDGTGAAVQVWELRHGQRIKYGVLSNWERSTAYRRITRDQTQARPKRSLYDEYGVNIFNGDISQGYSL